MLNLEISPARKFRGRWQASGDKSLSHRALIFNAMAEGAALVENLSQAADCRQTRLCLEALGVNIEDAGKATVRITGRGGDFSPPGQKLDAGNSGTTMRLLSGLLASQPFEAVLDGDESLRGRPMERIRQPLKALGAEIELGEGGTAPIRIRGGELAACDYSAEIPSAQVKGAFLLAALRAAGRSSYREPVRSRDHTERLMRAMGVEVVDREGELQVEGPARLSAVDFHVPGDPSSAAFLLAGGLLIEGGSLLVRNVCVNPTRAGFLAVLERMNARFAVYHPREVLGEEVADLLAQHSTLRATEILGEEVPSLIDEIPILAVLASRAEGESVFRGLGELRHKESDRLGGTVRLLEEFGVKAVISGDDLHIFGGQQAVGARFDPRGDHRMAMAASILGLAAKGTTVIEDPDCIAVSFPEFPSLVRQFSGKALKRSQEVST